MKEESGRSLIEIIGVLAIGAIMIVSAYRIYRSIDHRQTRLIASETLKDVATKVKTIYEFSGYENVTNERLFADGVLSSADRNDAPIGEAWEILGNPDGEYFTITLKKVSNDDCEYLKIKKADWAHAIKINNNENGTCSNDANDVSFIVK